MDSAIPDRYIRAHKGRLTTTSPQGEREIANHTYRKNASSSERLRSQAAIKHGARRLARRLDPGFTLLELLVVIVIIGLLAGLVVPRYFDTVGKSKAKIARAQMDSFEKALEQYRMEVGTLPSQEQGLQALVVAPAGTTQWQGPYLKKAIPLDPWGHTYIYKLLPNRREADIISMGADGQPGGTGEDRDIALSSTD
jgi:general secretion pathway protein G